jgi:hypothetical protein
MPTIREKISELSNLTPPVTIREALNSATQSTVVVSDSKTLEIDNELTLEINDENLTLELCNG